MFRMTVLVSCLCLFCAVTSAVAEDREGCVKNLDGTCAMEEGLQMLQSKPATIQRHGQTSADKPSKEHGTLQEQSAKAMKKEKGNATKDINKSRPEYEFERELLEESDIEKIRFRARHQNWVDILDLYKDGFLKRYHDHDAGTWHLNHDNKLVFNWLRWGAEDATMETTDKGKTFNSSNQVKFFLKSYVQPLWWRNQFDGSNAPSLLEESKKKSKKEIFADTKQIIRAHADGSKADLDEAGYLAVAMLKDDDEMRTYIHRLSESMGLQIVKEGGVSGLLPYYSGSSTYQTLQKLKAELTKAVSKKKGVRWILHQDDPQLALLQEDDPALALLQVPHHSSSKKHSSKEAKSPDTHHEVKAKQSKKLQDSVSSGTLLKERSESELKAQAAAQKATQERLDKAAESENERLEKERAAAQEEKERLRHEEQKAKAKREEEKYKESERILKENKQKGKLFNNKDKEPRHVGYFMDDGTWKSVETTAEAGKPLKHLPHNVGHFLENGTWEEAKTIEEAKETTKKHNSSSHTNNKSKEFEFEMSALQESDIEKVRFRARHQEWTDILELFKDGFFQRYHAHDAGLWHMNNDNQLVLKWLQWGEEPAMHSTDAGTTFNTTGMKKFTLKSYVQPMWWRKQFDPVLLQGQSKSAHSKKASTMNAKEIIRAHMDGEKAPLDESGYLALVQLKDNNEMIAYIRRVAEAMDMQIINEGGLTGVAPYYSGVNDQQTLLKLRAELERTARSKTRRHSRWVVDRDPSKLALLQSTNVVHKEEEQEIEFEKSELEESDIEKIRFRARHEDWIDILDLYRDGFFKRYHDHDVGVWRVNKNNQLVLKWLKWGEEEMLSQDGGKSFKTRNNNNSFTLKSYVQPRWWRSHFGNSNQAELQELSERSKTHKSQTDSGMKAIIAAHVDGKKVDLDEKGYQALAFLKDDHEMAEFVKRVVEALGMVVVNEGGLNGMVPYYSGTVTSQSLDSMKSEVKRIARAGEGERWVMDQNGQFPVEAGLSFLQEHAVQGKHEIPDASSKKTSEDLKTHQKKEEIELELDLLQESDIEKIRFRAKHNDWFDIMDLYKDGFFRRYHDGDLGVWHKDEQNHLVLKWLKWGEEVLRSSDDGKSFNGAGQGNFTLKSYKQPVWWRKTFDASSSAQLQELSQESKKAKRIKKHEDMMTIIGFHVNGKKAELNERGYEVVALQKNHKEMTEYIRRVAKSMDMAIVNDGGLNGIVPYYSGELTYQTLAKLKSEIMTEARKPAGARWVMDEGGDDPSHAL